MRVIALIMVAVAALDAGVAALVFRSWLAAAVALALVAVIGWRIRSGRSQRAGSKAAGWALGPAEELSDPDRPTRYPEVVIPSDVLNLGLLVIGSPGAGKTESVELGYLAALDTHSPASGWAFFEGKGDVDVYKRCVAMGRRPDHLFSTELPGSDSINLMAGEPHDVVDRLSKMLIGSTASTTFYADEQRAVLARMVGLLARLGIPVSLRDLYVVLSTEDAGLELLRRAQAVGAPAADVTLTRQWLEQPFRKRLEFLRGLLNRLNVFVAGPAADRLNAYQAEMDIHRIVTENRSVYLHLPLTTFARDVAIAIVEMFGVEARKRQLAGTEGLTRFPLLFDDWGAFFYEGFGPFAARCRSAAMPLTFGFQSYAQLEAVSRVFAHELDDTIATKVVMRVQGAETADYAVRLLGEHETVEVSTSRLGDRSGTSVGYRRVPRIEPRDLRELRPGEAFVSTLIRDGDRVINPLWRLRFSLPDFGGWRDVPLPPPRVHAEGDGLGFWARYMDPEALARLHAAAQDALEREAQERAGAAVVGAAAERARLAANPGFRVRPVAST